MSAPSTRNITRCFRAASDEQRAIGMDWYLRANRLAHTLDPENPRRAAGVIASMSPLMSWPTNVNVAIAVYSGKRAKGLLRNVAKCHAIYDGADPADILSGPKVTAFFSNIIDPINNPQVTVDRHAIDIACGKVQSDAERNVAIKGKSGYANVAVLYSRAAAILSKEYGYAILPYQVQAVTWVSWRAANGKVFKGDW